MQHRRGNGCMLRAGTCIGSGGVKGLPGHSRQGALMLREGKLQGEICSSLECENFASLQPGIKSYEVRERAKQQEGEVRVQEAARACGGHRGFESH